MSRVTWEITPHEQQSKLALIHEGLDPDSEFARNVQDGWAQIMSTMKTYLETQRVPVAVGDYPASPVHPLFESPGCYVAPGALRVLDLTRISISRT